MTSRLFEPFAINGVAFRSRVLRSSLGGRMAYYDGTVAPVWKNFERRFARPEFRLGALISATIDVDAKRVSPLEYPSLSHDRFIGPLATTVGALFQTIASGVGLALRLLPALGACRLLHSLSRCWQSSFQPCLCNSAAGRCVFFLPGDRFQSFPHGDASCRGFCSSLRSCDPSSESSH